MKWIVINLLFTAKVIKLINEVIHNIGKTVEKMPLKRN